MKQIVIKGVNKWKKSVEKRKEIIRIAFENQYKSKGNFMKTFIWKKNWTFVHCFKCKVAET